ncbi:MAG: nitroreductase/quinone reductase family protein, partial [Mycobacterium sp.]
REPEGEERHRIWVFMAHVYPPYLSYQKATTRHIPVIMLTPVTPIDVFEESDLQSS